MRHRREPTLSEAQIIAEIIAHAATALGISAAGIWALFSFRALRQRDAALLDYRRGQLELQSMERDLKATDLQLRQRAVLSIELNAEVFRDIDGTSFVITCVATVRNTGCEPARLEWIDTPPAFSVHRAVFGEDGVPTFPTAPIDYRIRQSSDPNRLATTHGIRSGGMQQFAGAFKVSEPAMYLLSFRAQMDIANRPGIEANSADAQRKLGWTSAMYVRVPPEHRGAA